MVVKMRCGVRAWQGSGACPCPNPRKDAWRSAPHRAEGRRSKHVRAHETHQHVFLLLLLSPKPSQPLFWHLSFSLFKSHLAVHAEQLTPALLLYRTRPPAPHDVAHSRTLPAAAAAAAGELVRFWHWMRIPTDANASHRHKPNHTHNLCAAPMYVWGLLLWPPCVG